MGKAQKINSDEFELRFLRSTLETDRVFLFLQGHPSKLWQELADALEAYGHTVKKIHLSLADLLFWRHDGVKWYWGRQKKWSEWLDVYLVKAGITDVVYYNDRFPYHETAMHVAQRRGLRTWCIEFGYLRPDWITLEPGGMGERSRLRTARMDRLHWLGTQPDMMPKFEHRFVKEAVHEVTYNLVRSLTRPITFFYRPDFAVSPLLEYLGWFRHALNSRADACESFELEEMVREHLFPYYLFAMQMDGDYQVRASNRGGMCGVLEEAISSFATHAPKDCRLLVKAHPLEGGLRNWRKRVGEISRQHGVEDRVTYFRGGCLRTFLIYAEGLVVLNSTSGLEALKLGTPTMVMGSSVYERDGLTHQSALDTFWTSPNTVSPVMLSQFLKALSLIQVKGSFYDKVGREQAIKEMTRRMSDGGPCAIHRLLPLSE